MSEAAPERIYAHHHREDDPGHPFEGWWHCDDGAAGPGMSPLGYVRGDLHAALQQRVEELEAGHREAARALANVLAGKPVRNADEIIARAALTPPEQQ